jgi:fatty-acyl-CoA synthase
MVRRFDEDYGVRVVQGWGMTETSPLGTTSTFKSKNLHLPKAQQYAVQATQGRGVFGIEMKIVDAKGAELPWDGNSAGDLMVRGAWVLRSYFRDEGRSPLVDGWFPTGDVARIAADGYMQITDRSKDVIKSGGEWIGSIDLENIAMSHPAVEMAACIAAKHAKWDERPLLVVVKKPGAELTKEALLAFYDGKIAKWWKPDDVVFVPSIALGGTGKMLKNILRHEFENHLLTDA